MSIETIRLLETLAIHAWPALFIEELDGWKLRFGEGVTRRANSVWPNENGGAIPLEERLSQVEAFYTQHNLEPSYQMSPAALPEDLDEQLAKRGYAKAWPTYVQTAPLRSVLTKTQSSLFSSVTIFPSFNEEWFLGYCRSETPRFSVNAAASVDKLTASAANVRRKILQRIQEPVGYALVRSKGQVIAVGLGVREGDWLGVYCQATVPNAQRRGAALAVLHALASFGDAAGASQMYLQVMDDNPAALALYARSGFETLYTTYYRVAPGRPGQPA